MRRHREEDAARRRAVAYWFVDGLAELAFGGVLVATATVLGVAAAVGSGPSGAVLAVGLPLVLVVGLPLAGRWVRRRKRQATYPRTGRVRYGRGATSRRIVHWTLLAGMAIGIGWVAWSGPEARIVSAGATALLAGLLGAIGLRTGLGRFVAAGAVAVVALAGSYGFEPDTSLALSTVLGITGLLVLRNGAAARMRYRREAPDPNGSDGT